MRSPEPLAPRLWPRIEYTESCWIWHGTRNPKGYGQIWYLGVRVYVHRLIYEIMVGPIPEGMQVDHLCFNTSCVNPGHLEPVTPLENVRRSRAPSTVIARTDRCARGHQLKNSGGPHHRYCPTCHRIRRRMRQGLSEEQATAIDLGDGYRNASSFREMAK